MAKNNEKLQAKVEEARKRTVEVIVGLMQEKGLSWIQEWGNAHGGGMMPRNGASGRWYAGGNTMHLWARALIEGWSDPRWFTFKQAKECGYFPEKGSHGTTVEYYKRFTGYIDAEGHWTRNKDEAERTVSYMKLVGVFTVFNAEQLRDGNGEPMPSEEHAPEPEVELDERLCEVADQLIATSRCAIHETKGEMRAFYRPADDFIKLPSRTQFTSMETFVGTLTHEMTHSTSKPLHRKVAHRLLDREGYAFEELVAELGSVFCCCELGIHRTEELEGDENFKNHAAYLKSWLGALADNPDYLFKAASKAGAAATYIIDRYEGKEEGGTSEDAAA